MGPLFHSDPTRMQFTASASASATAFALLLLHPIATAFPTATSSGGHESRCAVAVNKPAVGGSCDQDFYEQFPDVFSRNGDGNSKKAACYQYWSEGGDTGDTDCQLSCFENWLDKDPSKCKGDTFYLWDEPTTQAPHHGCYDGQFGAAGTGGVWAKNAWTLYAAKWGDKLGQMKQTQKLRITSPMFLSDSEIGKSRVDAFFDGCGEACNLIDVLAVNLYCNTGTAQGCIDDANYSTDKMKAMSVQHGNRPWFVTNWAYINAQATMDNEINAIKAMPHFFGNGSPVERVHYFDAKDVNGNNTPETANVFSKAPPQLKQAFTDTCAQIDSQYPLGTR